MKRLHTALLTVLCLAAVVAGFSLSKILNPESGASGKRAAATPSPESMIGQPRPGFTLPDLDHRSRSIAEWDGRVLLINFWATWCAPCREEIPRFQQWRARYPRNRFEVIGVALDRPDTVAEFRDELDIEYPLLHGRQKATAVLEAYGNRLGTLPYTVIVSADGIIADVHAEGALGEADLTAMLKPLLTAAAATRPGPGGN